MLTLNGTILSIYSGKIIYFKICFLTVMLLVLFLDVISYNIKRVFFVVRYLCIFLMFLSCLCNWPFGCCVGGLIVGTELVLLLLFLKNVICDVEGNTLHLFHVILDLAGSG